jgi:hypothetical protein
MDNNKGEAKSLWKRVSLVSFIQDLGTILKMLQSNMEENEEI